MLPRPLTLRLVTLRLVSVLLIAALVAGPLAPVVSAQEGSDGSGGSSVFLPLVSGGEGAGDPGGPVGPLQLYRTEIEVRTPAHWQTLARVGPVFLGRGDNWAQVLVDDEQLADLARLRFNPQGTNALTTLARAAAEAEAPLPEAVLALAGQVRAAGQRAAADAAGLAAAHAGLRAQMGTLPAADLAAVAAAAGVDTDGDGLTDDQGGFWCTDSTNVDSDLDGARDGAEVQSLRDWMDNKLYQAPASAKPFNGWPVRPDTGNCIDGVCCNRSRTQQGQLRPVPRSVPRPPKPREGNRPLRSSVG